MLVPPLSVVPYKLSPTCTREAVGSSPSTGDPAKLCSVVRVPLGVILKTVPKAVGSALEGCAVRVSVGGLQQRGVWHQAVALRKVVQGGEGAGRGDGEDGAVAIGPAAVRCSVEVSVAGLHQPAIRILAVVPIAEKLCSEVSVPPRLILKTVPRPLRPLAPPSSVVP